MVSYCWLSILYSQSRIWRRNRVLLAMLVTNYAVDRTTGKLLRVASMNQKLTLKQAKQVGADNVDDVKRLQKLVTRV